MVIPKKEQILSDIVSTTSLPDGEAADLLWVSLTRVLNAESEGGGQSPLLLTLSEDEVKRLLKDGSVDSLVFMDPPLEAILACPDEEPGEGSIMRVIGRLRSGRDIEPFEALSNLVKVLSRIRDRCTHGFEAVPENHAKDVMALTRRILYLLCMLVVSRMIES